ncbi:MAG: discoidin domain-containing protein [Paludibacteraceae bacterium]|nr:discoidin domain-containing protein [Paludibacteraceae bacterium]
MKRYLLPLLLTFISLASGISLYADTTYRLIDQSTGTLTGDLKYTGTVSSAAQTINNTSYTSYVANINKTLSNTNGNFNSVIGYDCKTTSTQVKVYTYEPGGKTDRYIYISEVKEGESTETHITSHNFTAKEATVVEYETTNTTNSTIFFYTSNQYIRIYQIEIIESGEPLLQGGESGYTLSFGKGRCNLSSTVSTIDGLEFVTSQAHAPMTDNYPYVQITTSGTHYIKFSIPVKSKITLGINEQKTDRYFCFSNTKGDITTTHFTPNSATVEVILNAGEYYVNPSNQIRFSSISFEAVASTIPTPTNFAISNAGVVSFDEVTDATRYELTMYDDDDTTPLFAQDVESGDELTRPFKKGGTFRTTLVAYIEDDLSEAAEGTWTLSDQSVAEENLPENTYCTKEIISNNNTTGLAYYTWETDEDGNINISISGDGASWRGNAFDGADKFKVGNVSAALFFDAIYTTGATTYQLRKKTGKNIALGEIITYNGIYRWKTTDNTDAWRNPVLTEYIYGTVCNQPDVLTSFSVEAQDIAKVGEDITLTINALNQKGTAMDVATEYTISPADAGSITDGVFTATKKGLVTITATAQKDQADEKSDNIEIFVYDDTQLISVGAETEGSRGAIDGYAANSPSLVVDGIANNYWQGYSAQTNPNQETFDAWIIIDLNKIYDVDYIQVCFTGGSSSRKYHLDFSSDKTNWVTAYSYDQAGGGRDRKDHWYTNTTNNKEVRYIRFFSTEANETYGLRVGEIYVYGELSADSEAPVMVSATYSDVTTNSVVLSVSATDNTTIAGYRLKGDKTGDYVATDGSFTVDGLLSGKAYTIRVYAIDQAGNESDNYMTVSFTTEGGAAPEEDTNLALGKTALAGRTEGNYTAEKAVDGNTTTKWGNYENNGELLDPETNWWQVDLGKAYTLESVKITWQHYPNYNGIVLLGSFDGSNWFDIIEYTGDKFTEGTTQTIDLSELQPFTRYVKIANRAGEGTSKWFMSFYEFEVYGTGGTYVMNLTENSDNSANITEFNNATVVATLDRSFLAGTDWYTLCLPFDMSDSQLKATFGDAYRLGKLVGSYWKGAESLFLEFDYVNHLEAGMPYVMRPSQDAVIPVISNVVVNAAAPIENRQGTAATMVGIYGPYQIPSDYYFLGANNYLLQNNNGSSMRGFRAYFKFEQQLPGNVRARIVMRSDQTTIATSLEQTIKPVQAEKFFQNGQLLIRKNGTIYTVLGIKAE